MIYYENPGAHDAGDPTRAMARRLVETRARLRAVSESHTALLEARDRDRHSRHGAWRRWRLTGRVAGRAYQLGIIAGSGHTWNGYCVGCLDGVRWRGRRPYHLGWARERWSCLLIGRHRRREIPGTNLCTVCAPCWVCRSTDPLHDGWQCEIDRDAARQITAALTAAGDDATRVTLSTSAGPQDVDAIRTVCTGLVVTAVRRDVGWTLTHVGTGRALSNGLWFATLLDAQAAAAELAELGDFTVDPRGWPDEQSKPLLAALSRIANGRMLHDAMERAR